MDLVSHSSACAELMIGCIEVNNEDLFEWSSSLSYWAVHL